MKNTSLFIILGSFLLSSAFAQNSTNTKANSSERIITADFNKEKGDLNTMFKECIGAGRANEGLRADWQQQLARVKKECDFKYIRFHGLLTDDMAVYREDRNGNPEYNYMYIDPLFDYLLSIGINAFFDIGFLSCCV